jgi:patatin-like phospholipase
MPEATPAVRGGTPTRHCRNRLRSRHWSHLGYWEGDGLHSCELDRVHKLLLATTAIPGIFPPVVIDGHVHADGGIVANLLPVLDLDGYRRLADRLRALGVTDRVTVRLWIVINLWTHPTPTVIEPSDRSAMSQRGTLLLFWTQQSQLPARLADLARAVSAGGAKRGDALHRNPFRARHRTRRKQAFR